MLFVDFFFSSFTPEYTTIKLLRMMKSYYFQVIPVCILPSYWSGFFSYFLFGNSAIMHKHSGFLYINNLTIIN
mgnify:CR=1 FL=1